MPINLPATNKLFQVMSLGDYEAAKTTYINGLAARYSGMTDTQKWDFIFERFKSTLSYDDREAFETFKEARKNTAASLFNLSLPDALEYFENFYFLYSTTDPTFRLSHHQRTRLLEGILDGISTCETGINERFNAIFQLYRTDRNWVTSTLYRARYNLIIRLQGMYLQSHGTGDAISIHVLPLLRELAASAGLGIDREQRIQDVYRSFSMKREVTKFFNQHYPAMFLIDYEDTIVDILSEQLLAELQDLYCPRGSGWPDNTVDIPPSRVLEFSTYIADRISLPDFNAYCIGEAGAVGQFVLKNKSETSAKIRHFIRKKLQHEKYFIPFEELTIESTGLRLISGIKPSTLIELNTAFRDFSEENRDNIAQLMKKHHKVILRYPYVVIAHLARHPQLLALMPKRLRNNAYFIEQAIESLDLAIASAIENDESIDALSEMLFSVARQDSDALTTLSSSVLQHVPFALKLVAKDGLLIRLLPAELQRNEDILNAAIAQNPLARMYLRTSIPRNPYVESIKEDYQHLRDGLPEAITVGFDRIFPTADIAKGLANLEKMQALQQLLENRRIDTTTTAKLVRVINPSLLLNVIRARKERNLPELPYCGNVAGFYQALSEDQRTNLDKGFWFLKKQVSRLARTYEGEYEKGIYECIGETNNWFLALARFQQKTYGPFSNLAEFRSQSSHSVKTTGALLGNILKIGAILVLGGCIGFGSLLLLNIMPVALVWGLAALCILAPIIAKRFADPRIHYAGNIISLVSSFIVAAPFWVTILTVFGVFNEARKLPSLISATFKSWGNTLSRLSQTLFFSPEHKRVITPASDLKTHCEESIMRLKLLNVTSAQQKAELLEAVWDKVNKDIATAAIPADSREEELGHRLTLPQEINHDGKMVRASFYQIASLRREGALFTVPDVVPAVSRHGFFSTTTMSILPRLAAVEEVTCGPVSTAS